VQAGSLQWQFGRYISDFSIATDRASNGRTSPGRSVSAAFAFHHSRHRCVEHGGWTTAGWSPLPNSRLTRFFVSYGGERVSYGGDGLVSTINCNGCFRSTLGFTLDHDTRLGTPFPVAGVHENIVLQLNGGPLGGTASFQRLTTEMRAYSTIATFGHGIGPEPMALVAGASARAGALFGNPGPFFVSQAFSLGGVQYGNPLRGYEEFSITPHGYHRTPINSRRSEVPSATRIIRVRLSSAFGSASSYISAASMTPETCGRPRDFDPTRLFRGAGFGASLVTPLGPLGVDLGYGFDRKDIFGHKDPKWQVHFKFGQIF
jgi:outer membrane protein insertion porin family